jgi:hypothetical protein
MAILLQYCGIQVPVSKNSFKRKLLTFLKITGNKNPEEKSWANFQRIIDVFTQKIFTKLSKRWVWDPGSGKNLFRIPGSKKHRIPDPDLQHCNKQLECGLTPGCTSLVPR